MPFPDLLETAIHEAGHAVVGWLTGHEISRITIMPEGRVAGETVFSGSCDRTHPVARTVMPTAHGALQKLAGPLAERLYGGGSWPRASEIEAAEAIHKYQQSGFWEPEVLFRATSAVLHQHDVRDAVFDVAEAVLRKRMVTGDVLHPLLAQRFGDRWRTQAGNSMTWQRGERGRRIPV